MHFILSFATTLPGSVAHSEGFIALRLRTSQVVGRRP